MSLKLALIISLSKSLVSLFKFEIETFFKDGRNLLQFVTSGGQNLHPPEKLPMHGLNVLLFTSLLFLIKLDFYLLKQQQLQIFCR